MMGFEDEYGRMDAVEYADRDVPYREALDAVGVKEAALEQFRQASYEGLREEFEPFLVSRATNTAGQQMATKRTYRRAREKVGRVEPEPDAVVVDRYLHDMQERLPEELWTRNENFGQGVKWKMMSSRERIEARGLTVAAAAIADTLDPWEKWDLSQEAQAVAEAGAYELPDTGEMRREAATVWQMFR